MKYFQSTSILLSNDLLWNFHSIFIQFHSVINEFKSFRFIDIFIDITFVILLHLNMKWFQFFKRIFLYFSFYFVSFIFDQFFVCFSSSCVFKTQNRITQIIEKCYSWINEIRKFFFLKKNEFPFWISHSEKCTGLFSTSFWQFSSFFIDKLCQLVIPFSSLFIILLFISLFGKKENNRNECVKHMFICHPFRNWVRNIVKKRKTKTSFEKNISFWGNSGMFSIEIVHSFLCSIKMPSEDCSAATYSFLSEIIGNFI